MQLCLKYKSTCQKYHEKNFFDYDFNWKLIYRLSRIATLETKIRIFQYKLLNNVLYLNKKLFRFGIISRSKCSFCELHDETPHICFMNARMHKMYGTDFDSIFQKKWHCQSAIFGFTNVLDHNFLLVNHLHVIFKYNIYNSRVTNSLSFKA